MNFITVSAALAAFVASVSALITITPTAGTFWYTNTPNYFQISSTDAAETYATVRFTGSCDCTQLTVTTNTSVPFVFPRQLRATNYLNIYAVSNLSNTAYSFVNVVNSLACGPCASPCASPCAGRVSRRGCGYYAEQAQAEQNQACQAELKFVAADSEEARAAQAQQELAQQHLSEDLIAQQSAEQSAQSVSA